MKDWRSWFESKNMAKILTVNLTLTSMNLGFRDIGSNPVLLPILDLYAGDGVMVTHVDISVK